MNVADAAYSVVRDYPGGAESLGPRVGIGPAVLRSKVNPNCTTHHLTLAEADRITGVTGDLRILHALAANHGQVLSAPVTSADCSDMAVLEGVAAMWATNGAFGQAVHHALADGRLTQDEMTPVRGAAYELQRRIAELLGRLTGMAQPDAGQGA